MRIFKKSVYFLFESGSLDSPGGPSSNRRYSITGVLRRRVIMNFTSKGPAEAKSTITLRRIHLIRRPYAKRRGRRETMFDCPLSKTVKILDQRSCRNCSIAVPKILERARETSPAARCHHGVAACIDLGGPSGLRCGAGADGLAELRHLALRVVQRQFVRGVEGVGFVLRH